MLDNIIIPDPDKFGWLQKIFKGQGKEKIHVLADFDRTLTKAFVNGQKVPSIISILRDGNYLTPDYAAQAHALFNKYHPLEISPDLFLAEKKKAMDSWWYEHNQLLIDYGLNKKDLDSVINSGQIELRPGAAEFFKSLNENNLPLVVMSASGIGDYCIRGLLKKYNCWNGNIDIISNSQEFDDQGRVIKFNEPFVHTANKDETIITKFPVYEKVKNRKNVILLGDNIEDIDMIKGFEYDNLLKIGFLNYEIEKNLEQYKQNYDVIILNDGNMDFINEILNDLI